VEESERESGREWKRAEEWRDMEEGGKLKRKAWNGDESRKNIIRKTFKKYFHTCYCKMKQQPCCKHLEHLACAA
jgi:hypothetical protein